MATAITLIGFAHESAATAAHPSDEIVLRAGGANGDMGYVRACALPNGEVVAVYYINDRADGDGERFIEATIWTP